MMFTSAQVAELLGRNRHYVIKIAREGNIPFIITDGGHARYAGEHVRDLILHIFQPPKVTPEWGAWFSGLVDGEGHFGIGSQKTSPHFQPTFSVKLSSYEVPLIKEIAEKFGLPHKVYHSPPYTNSQGYTSRPCVEFRIHSMDACYRLVELFRQFPLRSQKAKDFKIWAEFVELKRGYRYCRREDYIARQAYLYHMLKDLRASRRLL